MGPADPLLSRTSVHLCLREAVRSRNGMEFDRLGMTLSSKMILRRSGNNDPSSLAPPLLTDECRLSTMTSNGIQSFNAGYFSKRVANRSLLFHSNVFIRGLRRASIYEAIRLSSVHWTRPE